MKFKTKRDPFFVNIWLVTMILINAVIIVPIFFVEDTGIMDFVIVFSIDLIITGIMLWLMLDISYVFKENYLFVKCGFIYSRIQYKDITKITMKTNVWVGYRVLSSRDAIEIHYKTGILGSVKISPEQKELFIEEIVRRNSLIQIAIDY